MNLSNSLLLIGCGKMGGAVLNGLLKNGFSAGQIRVAEPNETVRAHLEAKGIACAASASELINVTRRLLAERYTEEEIRKIWGGNFLRVMREVQQKGAVKFG